MGFAALFQVARRSMGKAIWRLRNRLIAAYLLIAVVPIVLIMALVAFTVNQVVGQMGVYLVSTELKNRGDALLRQAAGLSRIPVTGDLERGLNRFAEFMRNVFPEFELRASGARDLRYPEIRDAGASSGGVAVALAGSGAQTRQGGAPAVRVGLRRNQQGASDGGGARHS